jgi:hypothetical protein
MKNSSTAMFLLVLLFPQLQAQKVSNLSYKLDNGINVKMERGWTNVWVQQRQDTFSASEQPQSVVVDFRVMGDLTKGSVFKLTSAGKDVRLKDATPGTYDLKITSNLSGKPGKIAFDLNGIVVKPKMKTTVSITVYQYQINIDETPGVNKGLASYDSKIIRFKGNAEQNINKIMLSFYAKDAHDKKISPVESISDNNGRMKPGTYDVLITFETSGSAQKIWLENFTMKPDINYVIATNLNAGEITYAGQTKDVKKIHMYPAGIADRQQGAARPDKTNEIISCDPAGSKFACPPGNYDVLINIGNGIKYEWRKNIVIRSGVRTGIR